MLTVLHGVLGCVRLRNNFEGGDMKTFEQVREQLQGVVGDRWTDLEPINGAGRIWLAEADGYLYMADGAMLARHIHVCAAGEPYSHCLEVLEGGALYGWDPQDAQRPLYPGQKATLRGPAPHAPSVADGQYVLVKFYIGEGSYPGFPEVEVTGDPIRQLLEREPQYCEDACNYLAPSD